MPNATITQATLSGTITHVNFINAIRDALISIGYTLFDAFSVTSTEHRIFTLTSSNATKGTIFLQISVNSSFGTFSHQLHETWNTSTKVGTNSAVNYNMPGFGAATTSVFLYAVNHPEAKLLIIEQGIAQGIIGVFRPKQSPPSWWNENNFAYIFQAKYSTSPANSRLGSTTSPFGNAIDYEYLQLLKLQDGNAQNNNARSILPLCILSAGTGGGIIASCDDVVICASNTMRPMDTITISPTEIYTYIWGNALNSGIAIRTT